MTPEDRGAVYHALNMHANYIETGDCIRNLGMYQVMGRSLCAFEREKGARVMARYARLDEAQRQQITYLRDLANQILDPR